LGTDSLPGWDPMQGAAWPRPGPPQGSHEHLGVMASAQVQGSGPACDGPDSSLLLVPVLHDSRVSLSPWFLLSSAIGTPDKLPVVPDSFPGSGMKFGWPGDTYKDLWIICPPHHKTGHRWLLVTQKARKGSLGIGGVSRSGQGTVTSS
jgi:hypothetical protein